jgi:hypothetical protein
VDRVDDRLDVVAALEIGVGFAGACDGLAAAAAQQDGRFGRRHHRRLEHEPSAVTGELEMLITMAGGGRSADDLRRYRDAGVDRVIAIPYESSRTAIDDIARYGDEVLAKLD